MTQEDHVKAAAREPELADILAQLTRRLQQGEPLDLEGITGRYPNNAQALRELAPMVQTLVDFGNDCVLAAETRAADLAAESAKRLGEPSDTSDP